jgi:hypothetical protein
MIVDLGDDPASNRSASRPIAIGRDESLASSPHMP